MTLTVGGWVDRRDCVWPSDDFRVILRARLMVRDGRACHYCSTPLGTKKALGQIDHLWPRSMGRIDALWNLVLACGTCNSTRGARLDMCRCIRCSRAQFLGRLVVLLNSPVRLRKTRR